MIKITVVAPYEDFIELYKKTFEEHNEHAYKASYEQNEYELEVIFAYEHDEVRRLNPKADVIVARGYSASLLRSQDYYIPVVELAVGAHDLARSLHESKMSFGNKKVFIMGSRDMVHEAESLSDVVNLEIEAYFLNDQSDDNIERVFRELITKTDCVVIGGQKVTDYANRIGVDNVLIKSGKASMWNSITEAKRAAYISRSEKAKALGFKTILDYAYEGIIAIDSENKITVFNSMSEKTLGISSKNIIGKKIDEVLPKSKLVDLLCSKGEYLNDIVKHNGMQLAINKVPIIMNAKNIGNVMTFQNVTKVQEMESTIRQKIYTRGHIAKYRFDDIIGKSKRIKEVINTSKGFSQVDANILIMGETGTGKEIFAQSIHNHSRRKDGPFVAINCAALPESLLESELFGYVEGAFTGAIKGGKPGLFELAHNGTIFLDEISEISLKIQGRLLRVIQEKEIMRLGHDRIIPVDVRIIAATNKNLFALSKKGDFREDLYYRLDILKINIPNVNERKEDIPILAESFIRKYGMKLKNEEITITSRAKKLLQSYDWTGNVRELINICERLVVMAQEAVIDKSEVEAVLLNHNTGKVFEEEISISHNLEYSHADELKNFEKERIKAVLEEVGHSKVKASEKLGISTTTLWRKIKQYKL